MLELLRGGYLSRKSSRAYLRGERGRLRALSDSPVADCVDDVAVKSEPSGFYRD